MLSFIIHKVALGKNYKRISCFREAWARRILLCRCTAKDHTVNMHRNSIQEIHFQFILLSLKGVASKMNVLFLNLLCIILFLSWYWYLHSKNFISIVINLQRSRYIWILCSDVQNMVTQHCITHKVTHIIETYFGLFTRCLLQRGKMKLKKKRMKHVWCSEFWPGSLSHFLFVFFEL